MSLSSDAIFTIAALVLGAGLAALMYWLEKQPRKDLSPRFFPTTLVLFLGILLALGAAIHLLSLGGLNIPQR